MSEQAETGKWPSLELPAQWAWADFTTAWTDSTDSALKLKQREYLPEGPLPVVDQGATLIGGYTDDLNLKNEVQLPLRHFR